MTLRTLPQLAERLSLSSEHLVPFGPQMAKLGREKLPEVLATPPRGRLVLVSAMTPTPKGEGKTTTAIGLAQGLQHRGHRVSLALRAPSLGPVFGAKGGGTGAGRSSLVPSSRINLHFAGDGHAVTAAANLLAAMVDDALIRTKDRPHIDSRRILWRRAIDLNDRALRKLVVGLGGTGNGVPREDGFDITAASEVMAVLSLATDIPDLKARLRRLVVAQSPTGDVVTAGEVGAAGAMAALLHDAILPNVVQSVEGVPAFVHGGPFANVSTGCNSIVATRSALALSDVVVTEAGFAFDLGGEKFFDIKCRAAGLFPSAVVLVATARALRFHGGDESLAFEGKAALDALTRGMDNLERHAESARAYGFEPVVSLNVFPQDTEEQLELVEQLCKARGLACARSRPFDEGGPGCEALAELIEPALKRPVPPAKFLYPLEASPLEKVTAIAKGVYGADGVELAPEAKKDLERAKALGFEHLPVCVAKTNLSLSDDPKVRGRPKGFEVTVRGVRVMAGAGYLLMLAGDILTLPGLPATPAALHIDLTDGGEVVGVA